jgi:hypothetical protein
MLHELKTWPEYFDHIWDGSKTFELRIDDRGFENGHHLHLREYDEIALTYTGREIVAKVTYLARHESGFGLHDGCVIMSFERLKWCNPNHRSIEDSGTGGWYPDGGYSLDEKGEYEKLLESLRA